MENGQKDDEEAMRSTSSMLPAQPRNGIMKTYENPARTFTRPYSAKNVYFYKEGDIFFSGVRLPVSHHRYKSLHNLMDELNRNMYLPYGVRNITTPMGRTNISSLDQLQHLGKYVASSSNPPKGVDLERIQEKYSATLRREPTKTTNGGHSYWMPTTPTLPARLKASHIFNYLKKLDSAKQVFFVLNGKGKFHRALINPMKVPTLEQILEECSTHLEVAIHRLYTPEGKLITTVSELLAYNGPRIIACPRNERPHLNEKSGSNMVKLPEINPARYAPRQPFIAVAIPVANTSTRGSGGAITSGSSSGNSIEKRQRLPVMNKRFVTKKTQENGIANTETTKNYISKSYSTKNRRPAPTRTNRIPRVTSAKASGTSSTEPNTSSNSAASSSKKDSGTGTSINSQQSERSMSMTEQKAKMIRDELRASLRQHLKQNSSSDQYSEEDMIREEESDYEQIGGGIHSGTSEEEEEEEEEHKRLKKRKKPSRGSSDRSNRTPSLRTPSTAASGRLSNGSTASKDRLETLSRQDTPFQETPSRKSSLASNRTHSGPKSNYSSRESTSSRAVLEPSDDEDENMEDEGSHEREDVLQVREDSEDEMAEDASRETPAIHTPDTRLSSAKSRKSTASSDENSRINSSSSSVAWSRISGSDKEMILPSDEEEDQYRDIGTAERERLGEAATKIQVAFKKYNSRRKRVQFEKERMEYEQRFQKYKIEILIGERYGVEFDTPLFIVLHGENGSSEKLYSQQKSWLFCDVDLSDKLLEIDLNEGRQIINSRMGIHMSRTTANLGQLTSIDIGHEREGYGAGTFIDRVFITEEGNTKGRRFYFQVEKWFDSEQIDGLIERSIPLSSFLYLEPSIINRKESKGRWEFRLHTMQSDLGGTTSNIIIYGYGMKDLVPYFIKNDSLLRDPYAVSKIQIDFGTDIGTLRKVRFEIDGAGDKPNFYLEYVEAQDLDTKERCVIMVHNWLLVGAIQGHRKWQPFREISLFMQSYMPLKNRTYEGTVTLGDQSMIVDDDTPIFLQCFNEGTEEDQPDFDTSGIFPVVPTKMKNKSINYTYKVDVVVVNEGCYPKIRVIPKYTKLGKDVLCAFNLLEDVYDAMSLRDGIPTDVFRMGKNLFVEEILHKEGDHIPHVMRYQTSNIDYEENNTKGPYFKNFFPRDSWPTSTERKRKKSAMKKIEEFSNWELLMSFLLKTGNPDIPNVELVTKDERTFEMECERKFEEGGALLRYKLTAPNFGNPFKCRVSLPQETPNTKTHIRKMILTELNTKTQIFFTVDKEFSGNSTEELPCTYPDIGIKEINDYEVNITTIEGGGNFRPYINIHGDGGDTGYRPYPGDKSFTLSPVSVLFISALDLNVLRSVEMWAKTGEPENWKGTIKVIVMNEWEFESGILELSTNGQIALSSLEFKRRIDPSIYEETSI